MTTTTEGKSQKGGVGQAPSTIRPLPPVGHRAPVMHYGTDSKASELSERGFRTEGYIMRDEHGNCALVHAGRIVQITNDELEELLDPTAQFSDEEES